MMAVDVAFRDLTSLRASLDSREISSVALIEACLDEIGRRGEEINAFTEVFEEDALAQAKYLDGLRKRRAVTGPLHGVPIAVKDLFDIAGRVNTGGTAIRRDHLPAARSAPAVAALEGAGAIIVGKANLDELAFGVASSNEHFGFVKNPWGKNLIPGGSSGGSAAALASGMACAALGTDTGGSVRIPAAFTATAALKVTTGLISTEGCIGVSSTLDSVGPMARSVRDLPVLLKLLEQTTSLRSTPCPPDGELGRLRLGVEESFYLNSSRMSVGCQKVMDRVLADLEAAGIELVPVTLGSIGYAEAAQKAIVLAEAANYHSGKLRDHRPHYGAIIRPNLALGDFVLAKDYLTAMSFRSVLAQEFKEAFEKVDFIVTPGAPFEACEHGTETYSWPDGSSDHIFDAAWRTFFPSNLIGIPSLCQPCGLTEDGLPIGLQLIGPALSERALLNAGMMLEREFNWTFRVPL